MTMISTLWQTSHYEFGPVDGLDPRSRYGPLRGHARLPADELASARASLEAREHSQPNRLLVPAVAEMNPCPQGATK